MGSSSIFMPEDFEYNFEVDENTPIYLRRDPKINDSKSMEYKINKDFKLYHPSSSNEYNLGSKIGTWQKFSFDREDMYLALNLSYSFKNNKYKISNADFKVFKFSELKSIDFAVFKKEKKSDPTEENRFVSSKAVCILAFFPIDYPANNVVSFLSGLSFAGYGDELAIAPKAMPAFYGLGAFFG